MRVPNVRCTLRLSLLLAFGTITGCADSTMSLQAKDPLLAVLEARGFPAELAVDAGDTYLVDGDIVVRKADLRARPQAGDPMRPRMQYQTSTTAWGATVNLNNIAGNTAWLEAARAAIAMWNAVPGSAMRLTETTGTANITVRFGTCSGGTSNTIACADFPSQYTSCWPSACYAPGPFITIHTGFTGTLSTDGRRIATAHEMGHALGFRHTDWNNRICNGGVACSEGTAGVGAVHIPGTPTSTTGGAASDPGSVMNALLQLGVTGFSYYDRVAARQLWPNGPGPNNDAVLEGGNPRISWQPVQDAAYYEVFFSQVGSCGWICYGPAPSTTTYVGSTSSTTYLDTLRSFSNIGCYPFAAEAGYQVRVTFTDGKQSALGGWSAYNGGGTCFS